MKNLWKYLNIIFLKIKIYNVGGFWFYEGDNKINVKKEVDGKVSYDFWKVTYHDIDFSNLHKVK